MKDFARWRVWLFVAHHLAFLTFSIPLSNTAPLPSSWTAMTFPYMAKNAPGRSCWSACCLPGAVPGRGCSQEGLRSVIVWLGIHQCGQAEILEARDAYFLGWVGGWCGLLNNTILNLRILVISDLLARLLEPWVRNSVRLYWLSEIYFQNGGWIGNF